MGVGARARPLLLLLGLALLGGCAAYHERMAAVEDALAEGRPEQALERLDAGGLAKDARDRPLYLLNRAVLLLRLGEPEAAIAALDEAASLLDEAAVLSVSEQAAALGVNEGQRSYAGAPYERRLVHVFLALAYLELGRLEAARVEALQIDLVSQALAQRGEPEDPLARWLAGMIFEALGEWDQALVAYRKALAAYEDPASPYALPVPRALRRDLVRAATAVGLADEARRLRERFHLSADDPRLDPRRRAREAELIVFYLDNLAPLRLEFTHLVQQPGSGRLVRLSLPYQVPRPSPVDLAQVQADGHMTVAEKALDIARLSQAWLDRQLPKLLARAATRAVVKDRAARQVSEEHQLLGTLLNLWGVASERADTRGWSLLPDNIRVARLPLAPGRYLVWLRLEGAGGATLARLPVGELALEAGETAFRSLHWVDPRLPRWWEAPPPDPHWLEAQRLEGPP